MFLILILLIISHPSKHPHVPGSRSIYRFAEGAGRAWTSRSTSDS